MGCCSSKKKSRAVPELDPSEVDQIWHKSMEEAYKHIKMHNDHLRKAEICRDREDHARCRMYQELAQVEWKASREARIEGEKEFFKEMNHSAYDVLDFQRISAFVAKLLVPSVMENVKKKRLKSVRLIATDKHVRECIESYLANESGISISTIDTALCIELQSVGENKKKLK
mmetsp:Transcript_225/g.312  ORF Transcript_225/g.312 Transcript_225/m.312 type:complete len:172 (-) Transcript_225:111-626(-)